MTLCALAAGCSPSRKELMAELDSIKAQLGDAQSENVSLRERISKLEQDLAAQRRTIDDLLAKNQANEAELAELRAAKAEREKELQVYKNLFARLKKLIDAGMIKVVFRKGKMCSTRPRCTTTSFPRARSEPTTSWARGAERRSWLSPAG